MSKGLILLAGSLAQRPGHGGHTWVFLQYLLGFRRLGWDVVFLDWLDGTMCVDTAGRRCGVDKSWNLSYFREVMDRFGIPFSLNYNQNERLIGLTRPEVLERARQSVFLLNVMGFYSDFEILAATPRRVFLDIDPGFGQMWQELGLAKLFLDHDAYVTIGENIGQPDCTIPTCGIDWITTPQPVVLDEWLATENSGGAFTGVASWRGPFGPIEYRGKTYGLRVHEFRKFARLPKLAGERFDLALDIHPSESNDLALLRDNGWTLPNPRLVAGDPWRYREFIGNSKAEFMVAKNMYVETRGGWFSDRSICYLASGRPVLAQETGFSRNYPARRGLIAFSTLDEAIDGVKEIASNHRAHSRAAREIAEAHFDSDKVLTRLLQKLGVA